jgi:hypothetical protein
MKAMKTFAKLFLVTLLLVWAYQTHAIAGGTPPDPYTGAAPSCNLINPAVNGPLYSQCMGQAYANIGRCFQYCYSAPSGVPCNNWGQNNGLGCQQTLNAQCAQNCYQAVTNYWNSNCAQYCQ